METNQQNHPDCPVEKSQAKSVRSFTSDEIQHISELMAKGSMSSYEQPSGIYSNRGFTIKIEPLNKGYLATVGCQRIAISNKETLKKHFCDYIDNPEKFTKKYNNNEIEF